MYANRYSRQNSTKRPNPCDATEQGCNQPVTTERMQRIAQYLENHGINVRTEQSKIDTTDIRWLG